MSTTATKKLGDLVRVQKDARPPDQSEWGSEAAPPAAGSASSSPASSSAAGSASSSSPAASSTTDELPPYLQLERVQTRIDPEVMTAIRTAEVRLKAARRPGAGAGERLNTNTVLRAALRAVVDSGALETCSGATEAELAVSIREQLRKAAK